jgi:hypothetical protein
LGSLIRIFPEACLIEDLCEPTESDHAVWQTLGIKFTEWTEQRHFIKGMLKLTSINGSSANIKQAG